MAITKAVDGKLAITKAVDGKLAITKAVDGKFTITANLGYIYNFASKWRGDFGGGNGTVNGVGNSAVGYGASLGYTHRSGFGLSADYLGFNNKWSTGGNNYDASFHALTLTPSYRFALDADKHWGVKIGLGIGFSLSDITWGSGGNMANAVAGTINSNNNTANSNIAGKIAAGAQYSQYSGSADSPFTIPLCNNQRAHRINDSSAKPASDKNTCLGPVQMVRLGKFVTPVVANITDAAIAQWFISDGKARLGVSSDAEGGTEISFGVWGLLLKGADGDASALQTLTPVVPNATATMVTTTQANKALKQLISGYDGASSPFSYDTIDFFNTQVYNARHTAAELGINKKEADRMSLSGIRFRGAAGWVDPDPVVPDPVVPDPVVPASKAKDGAGFVLVPQVALEYDNGMLHGDINVRYIHALKNVTYDGTGYAIGKTYSVNAGPAALFVGVGFGINF